MINDHEIIPQAIAKPRSFVGLMTLYESNFIKLHNLLPDLRDIDKGRVLESLNAENLYLTILEKTKYTITFSLTYSFKHNNKINYEPNLTIRAYYDGDLAEVISIGDIRGRNQFREIVNQNNEIISKLWKKNIVFNKWLDYLLDNNYS